MNCIHCRVSAAVQVRLTVTEEVKVEGESLRRKALAVQPHPVLHPVRRLSQPAEACSEPRGG